MHIVICHSRKLSFLLSHLNHVKKLELLVCQTDNCEENFLGGGKSTSFPFSGSFRQSNRHKGLKKNQKFQRGGRVNDFGIWKAWEVVRTFWNFRSPEGVKMFMPPMLGCGYFLESPSSILAKLKHS